MNIEHIKKLRSETGLSMAEIKKALERFDGDYEKAKEALSQLIKDQDTSARVASKGMCQIRTYQDQVILLEITGETDFVIKNPYFINLFNDVFDILFHHEIMTIDALNQFTHNNELVETYVKKSATKIGENVSIRRFNRFYKTDKQGFGIYQHQDGKNISLVILSQKDDMLQKNLPMQIVAYDAKYISHRYLTEDDKKILKESYDLFPDSASSFDDYLMNKSLIDQPFMLDDTKSVSVILQEKGIKIIKMMRYTLGEGIKHKLECRLDIPNDASKISVKPIF